MNISSKHKEIDRSKREVWLQDLLAFSPTVLYILRRERGKFRLNWVSDNCERVTGFMGDEMVQTPDWWRNQVHPDDRSRVLANQDLLFKQGELMHEYRLRHKSGHYLWIRDKLRVIRDAKGRAAEIHGAWSDITGRRVAEQALQESENRFQLLAQASNDAIWEWDLQSDQNRVRSNFESIFGHTIESVNRSTSWWTENLHPQDRERILTDLQAVIVGDDHYWSGEYRFRRSEGSYAYVLDRAYVQRDARGKALRMLGGMTDITDRKRAEQRSHLQYLITRILIESSDLGDASGKILKCVCQHLHWDRGELWKVDDKSTFKCVASWDQARASDSSYVDPGNGFALSKGEGLPGWAWREGRPVWITDLRQERGLLGPNKDESVDYLGAFAVPIRKADSVIAVLAFFSRDIQWEDTQLMESLVSIGHQIALFFERTQADKQLKRQLEQLKILSQTSQQINSVLEMTTVMRTLVTSAMKLVNADSGMYGLREGNSMVFHEYQQEGKVVRINSTCPEGKGVPGWVMRNGKPYLCNRPEKDPLVIPEIIEALQIRNFVNVPIFNGQGECLGCLEIFNKHNHQTFDLQDVELLQGLAANAAVALENARMLAIRKEAEETLRRLPQRILDAQEAERRRVSRELHDSVNQLLASVRFRLQSIESRIPQEAVTLQEETGKTKQLLENALSEVRRISHNLRPSELDDLGLVPAIRAAGEEFSARSGVRWELEIGALPERLPTATELSVYRIFQESLNNVERHARAARVQVQLVREAGYLTLRIRDDGIGFDRERKSLSRPGHSGIGLENIRERAAFIQGELSIRSAPGQGTEITLRFPLKIDETEPGIITDHPHFTG